MKTLFIADPTERLKPTADSSLAMLREALRRGHAAYWGLAEHLEYRAGELRITARRCLECGPDDRPRLGEAETLSIAELHSVFIRKDPPFDASYVRLCWLLSLVESKVRMINKPSLLLRYHEKLVPLEALALGYLESQDLIPTYIGDLARAKSWAAEHGYAKVIAKPFLGFGGSRVHLFEGPDFQKWVPKPEEQEELMVQPFEPAVLKRGDRRVFFLQGKLIGDFVRMPAEGNFVSNLAQGGSAVAMPLEAEEKVALERLGKFLAHAGIVFAGADLIGTKISEVNITSPTGIRSLLKLENRDISSLLWDAVEKLAL